MTKPPIRLTATPDRREYTLHNVPMQVLAEICQIPSEAYSDEAQFEDDTNTRREMYLVSNALEQISDAFDRSGGVGTLTITHPENVPFTKHSELTLHPHDA